MTEKVKVSRETAEAIELTKKAYSNETILELHADALSGKTPKWTGAWEEANKLTLFEMAQILINGYEIEETPEEKFLRVYQMQLTVNRLDFADGMKYALETLGIKIKGIND